MSEARRRLWIDADPGVDDAWAVLMAARDPSVEVLGLSTVAGNVGLEHTTANALRLVEWLGRPIPVYRGAERALLWAEPGAAFVHGADGFGDAGLPPPMLGVESVPAAQALIDAAARHPGTLDLVALGPLTNLALAASLDAEFPRRLRRLVVMGGALDGRGNTRPTVEFNFGFDALAAAIVFDRFPRIELVDWEACLLAAPNTARIEALLAAPTPSAAFMYRISRATAAFVRRERGACWPWADPLAMLTYLAPECVLEDRRGRIWIECAEAERGRSHLVPSATGPVIAHRRFRDGALERAMAQALA